MSNESNENPEVPDQVRCKTCQREIPRTDALKDEAEDYVLWFCGLDCYQKWQQGSERK